MNNPINSLTKAACCFIMLFLISCRDLPTQVATGKLPSLISDNVVYTAYKSGDIVATSQQNHHSLWHENLHQYLAKRPVDNLDTILLIAKNSTVVAIDKISGNLKWYTQTCFPYTIKLVQAKKQLIQVQCSNQQIIGLHGMTGKQLWTHHL